MATIPCTVQLIFASTDTKPINSSITVLGKLNSQFVGMRKGLGFCRRTSRIGPSCGSRTTCWFKFGKNGVDSEGAGIYGSQSRDDFDRDDVEQVSFLTVSIVLSSSKFLLAFEHYIIKF